MEAEGGEMMPECPTCGGVADNGHDRENPPNYYECKACELCPTEQYKIEIVEGLEEALQHEAEWRQCLAFVGIKDDNRGEIDCTKKSINHVIAIVEAARKYLELQRKQND